MLHRGVVNVVQRKPTTRQVPHGALNIPDVNTPLSSKFVFYPETTSDLDVASSQAAVIVDTTFTCQHSNRPPSRFLSQDTLAIYRRPTTKTCLSTHRGATARSCGHRGQRFRRRSWRRVMSLFSRSSALWATCFSTSEA